MKHDIKSILFTSEQINNAVNALGERLSNDYNGKKPLLLCVLKGSSVFHSDLIRAMDIPLEIDFIVAKSYGTGTRSSGKLEILKEPDADLAGRDVIIVEDILDTAVTLSALTENLSLRNPASLKTAAFIDKDLGTSKPLKADYKCFDAPNEFLVGYGLDYAEKYRNLPYVGILKREIYE